MTAACCRAPGVSFQAVERRAPVIMNEYQRVIGTVTFPGERGAQSGLAVPILHHGSVLGTVSVSSRVTGHQFHPRGRRAARAPRQRRRRRPGTGRGCGRPAFARRPAGHADPGHDADLTVLEHGGGAPRHRERRLDSDGRDGGELWEVDRAGRQIHLRAVSDQATRLPVPRPTFPSTPARRPGRVDLPAGVDTAPEGGPSLHQRRRLGRAGTSLLYAERVVLDGGRWL